MSKLIDQYIQGIAMRHLLIILIFVFTSSSTFAMPADYEQARQKTNELLMNKAARDKYIKGKAGAMAADQKVHAITSDPKQQEAIYQEAANVFNEVHAKVKGDPKALEKMMDEAHKNPKAFYESLSPAQQQSLRDLAKQFESQQHHK